MIGHHIFTDVLPQKMYITESEYDPRWCSSSSLCVQVSSSKVKFRHSYAWKMLCMLLLWCCSCQVFYSIRVSYPSAACRSTIGTVLLSLVGQWILPCFSVDISSNFWWLWFRYQCIVQVLSGTILQGLVFIHAWFLGCFPWSHPVKHYVN